MINLGLGQEGNSLKENKVEISKTIISVSILFSFLLNCHMLLLIIEVEVNFVSGIRMFKTNFLLLCLYYFFE